MRNVVLGLNMFLPIHMAQKPPDYVMNYCHSWGAIFPKSKNFQRLRKNALEEQSSSQKLALEALDDDSRAIRGSEVDRH